MRACRLDNKWIHARGDKCSRDTEMQGTVNLEDITTRLESERHRVCTIGKLM